LDINLIRTGTGYDVHRFSENRRLILGGVEIPFPMGLLGHSDADVLVHAIMDSLLGAASLGDIGVLFPADDERFRGADSLILLKALIKLLTQNNWFIGNIDSVIIADKPKLSPYIRKMRENISGACGIPFDSVSVKATTEEGLGLAGQGIGANAVCLIYK
jgi:2-C-methyl-D-erythritol 2,4-cyclodiphosphate synthase